MGLTSMCRFLRAKTTLFTTLLVLAALPSEVFSQAPFRSFKMGDAADGEGCALVDFDGDNDLDIFVTGNNTGSNLLYRNDGDGFTRITTGPLVNSGTGSISASWADFDNDGLLDVFVSKQSGLSQLFRQQAGATFLERTFLQTTLATGSSFGAGWADYDNDGFVDLLVADRTQNVLWHNDGRGSLTAVKGTAIITAPDYSAIAWADYNQDGRMDVFVTGRSRSQLYRNDGSGRFTAVANGPLVPNSTGCAWGDYDNDGWIDLFVCRLDNTFHQAFPSVLFRNEGNGTFTQIAQNPFTTDVGYATSCGWGDYDNDGWLDLFVTDFGGGRNRLYHNNANGTLDRVVPEGSTDDESILTDRGSSAGASWGDYDGNGFLDVFVSNGTNGGGEASDYLYYNYAPNDGNTNGWLTVKCIGTVSNRSAIGAKVRAKVTMAGKTLWLLREITTGDGWAGKPLEAYFGMGNATKVETLRIEWPSGTIQDLENVPSKQYLIVSEPARLQVTAPNGRPTVTLLGGRAMNYDIHVSPDFKGWSPLTNLTVTNVNGSALITDSNISNSGTRFYRSLLR
jgi:hypothetical protein